MRVFKKGITLLLTAALMLSLAASLSSCSTRLKGTYTLTEENPLTSALSYATECTYVFEGKTVKYTEAMVNTQTEETVSLNASYSGEYDISYRGPKTGYEITFIWNAEGKYAGKSEEERTETKYFKKMNTYIQIGDKYYDKMM